MRSRSPKLSSPSTEPQLRKVSSSFSQTTTERLRPISWPRSPTILALNQLRRSLSLQMPRRSATFLSNANPYLPKDALNGLLLAHGGHHIQQIQQLQDHRYASEARTWEDMKNYIYQIADATADALAKQFAKRFA